jgi:hypothetical protein
MPILITSGYGCNVAQTRSYPDGTKFQATVCDKGTAYPFTFVEPVGLPGLFVPVSTSILIRHVEETDESEVGDAEETECQATADDRFLCEMRDGDR